MKQAAVEPKVSPSSLAGASGGDERTTRALADREQRLQRQQALGEARRALVLDAARAVFSEMGLEGASIREIARRAGYTAGALYSYFDSKEAIYAALLQESLERLEAAVAAARAPRDRPARTLSAKALAWFNFYLRHPRDLDLGFYLVHGLGPKGLTSEFNQSLNERLLRVLQPCEDALVALGLDEVAARRENAALFAHGMGLLLLQHTGRIRLFSQQSEPLFSHYLEHLLARLASMHPAGNDDAGDPGAAPPADNAAVNQRDLFGA
ncbi:MAG: TetR/AcrR family transcriptional regulator [Betaproteobacteria bacterium]|jgi:AcrR family transcriptional regulator|nr:TetR/AcrR family transcriptional regulator [Betaproteobacteria bacterium]